MNHDLDAARGILTGIFYGALIWAALILIITRVAT